ncbi:hypothetical protein [Gordonibacter massiliensis (ex Traore et al. 2017)]|uniref:hypothetical protein n=1 Tax=Gordonibacter massiliensis (ex Traore et al. 2017) TaxID=1841863 RepID=UPI001C8BBF33|nr:hypothetical protein [Gordonibacter massiliensis (ex Traore et al. 2017)]MBX9035269.1 VWA domain-containing protein [Gordonibacter massiliensis (ex Traore et al. 2017)]
MIARIEQVKRTVERVAAVSGLRIAAVCVGAEVRTGCRLTRSGIDLLVNHELNEDIAARERYGVRGAITLDEVDTMVACFVATRAQDFLLDDWCQRFDYRNDLSRPAQRYLQTCVDDMAAYARMISRVPFAKQHFEAYLSRMAAHVMASEPLHIQLMRALRLYLFEDRPNVVVSPLVVECLGTTSAMNPCLAPLKRLLFDESLPYRARHTQAASLITPLLARMIKFDEEALSFYDLMHLYDNEQSYGASKDAANDENALRQEAETNARAQALLATVNESTIDQLIADNNETPVEADKTPSLNLPSVSPELKAMAFHDGGRASYEHTAQRWRDTIERIANVLVRIATPQERLSVFRYRARLARSGTRMHPSTLVQAHLQLQSGCENAIWQKRQRRSRLQNLQFRGMDLYVLLDVSISMTGENASSAGAMAVCLIEGIDRAIQLASHDQRQGSVDIRTQLLAFGEGWAELTPLELTHAYERKRYAFEQVNNPTSEQTLVTAALRQVQIRAVAEPARDVVCLVVSDGLFADGLQARKCAMSLPSNVYLTHINIGEFNGLPLTSNFETIQDPALLPEKLHLVLARQLDRRTDSPDAARRA